MIEKKPAHIVVMEMIQETMKAILNREPGDESKILAVIGVLCALLQMLKRMIIPTKHKPEILKKLREIKSQLDGSIKEELIPESIFTEIINSENSIVVFLAEGNLLSSPEGLQLINEIDDRVLKEAASDPYIAGIFAETMNRTQDVFVRRKLLLALSK